MKKAFKTYIAVWAMLLALYNVVVFFIRPLPGYTIHYDARFWVAWGCVIAAYIGQLFCAYIAFKSENQGKLFLHIPLIKTSYSAIILMTVISSICMMIPGCPTWITIIICALFFAFSFSSVLKAKTAADLVSAVDEKVKTQTFFIKSLTADADTLLASAKSEEAKAACQKVYEAVRYSDPMSHNALSAVEGQITLKFAELSAAVEANDLDAIQTAANAVLVFVRDRNNKCQLLK